MAMKISTETLLGIRYKLMLMVVPISGPSYIYGGGMSVIKNFSASECTLKKKNNSIFYHAVRESIVMGESLTGNVGTNNHYSDLYTNVLYGGKRKLHVSNLLYDIYDDL